VVILNVNDNDRAPLFTFFDFDNQTKLLITYSLIE